MKVDKVTESEMKIVMQMVAMDGLGAEGVVVATVSAKVVVVVVAMVVAMVVVDESLKEIMRENSQ